MITMVVFMVILINKNETEISFKYLSVDTYYSYLDQEAEQIYIDFYLNTKKHPLVDEKSYHQLKIHDLDDSKSMNLELKNIIFLKEESYLNETYYKYSYVFDSPVLGYDFDIKDCYLNIELINEDVYDVFIGSFSLKSIDEDRQLIDWTALSGKKDKMTYISRLQQIDVEYVSLSKPIQSISVGNLYDVSYEVTDSLIKISIPFSNQLFISCPIIITFESSEVNAINYFVYMKEFETLKQSGQLIYHYALN